MDQPNKSKSKDKLDIFSHIINAELIKRLVNQIGWSILPYLAAFIIIMVLLNFFATIGALSLVLLYVKNNK